MDVFGTQRILLINDALATHKVQTQTCRLRYVYENSETKKQTNPKNEQHAQCLLDKFLI